MIAVMTPEDFLEGLDEPRRSELRTLHELIRSTAPGLEPVMTGTTIGYGPFHYRYETGREGDATVLSLANNKNYISLYVLCTFEGGYLAEQYKGSLPKADIGKSCVRIKRLDDVDLGVVKDLVAQAAELGAAASAS